jgi:hypothetical protein
MDIEALRQAVEQAGYAAAGAGLLAGLLLASIRSPLLQYRFLSPMLPGRGKSAPPFCMARCSSSE